jgi:hypothetical protein
MCCAVDPLNQNFHSETTERMPLDKPVPLAKPEWTIFDETRGHLAETAAFQPCMRYNSQGRFAVRHLHGKKWTLISVFDGTLY